MPIPKLATIAKPFVSASFLSVSVVEMQILFQRTTALRQAESMSKCWDYHTVKNYLHKKEILNKRLK